MLLLSEGMGVDEDEWPLRNQRNPQIEKTNHQNPKTNSHSPP
jgi:hypothetical protein